MHHLHVKPRSHPPYHDNGTRRRRPIKIRGYILENRDPQNNDRPYPPGHDDGIWSQPPFQNFVPADEMLAGSCQEGSYSPNEPGLQLELVCQAQGLHAPLACLTVLPPHLRTLHAHNGLSAAAAHDGEHELRMWVYDGIERESLSARLMECICPWHASQCCQRTLGYCIQVRFQGMPVMLSVR